MDYNNQKNALTPCQLGKIHSYLTNSGNIYTTSNYYDCNGVGTTTLVTLNQNYNNGEIYTTPAHPITVDFSLQSVITVKAMKIISFKAGFKVKPTSASQKFIATTGNLCTLITLNPDEATWNTNQQQLYGVKDPITKTTKPSIYGNTTPPLYICDLSQSNVYTISNYSSYPSNTTFLWQYYGQADCNGLSFNSNSITLPRTYPLDYPLTNNSFSLALYAQEPGKSISDPIIVSVDNTKTLGQYSVSPVISGPTQPCRSNSLTYSVSNTSAYGDNLSNVDFRWYINGTYIPKGNDDSNTYAATTNSSGSQLMIPANILGLGTEYGNYTITCKAYLGCYSENTSSISVNVISCGGRKEYNNLNIENSTIIYPNPNDGTFTINFPSSETVYEVQIVDLLGNVILKEAFSNTYTKEYKLTNVSNGMYIVNLSGAGVQKRTKVQVIR